MRGVYASAGVEPRVCGGARASGHRGPGEPAGGVEVVQVGAAAGTLGRWCVGGAAAERLPGVVEQRAELLLRLPEAV